VKRFLIFISLSFLALPSYASLTVRVSKRNTVDVAIVNEPVSASVAAIQPFLTRHVDLLVGTDPTVTLRAAHIAPDAALRAIVEAAHVQLVDEHGRLWIRDTKDPSVTLDVKDADVHDILKSMQQQCGIKNLMIDPQVQGSGTFLFRDVPCRTAFDVVLRSLGLSSTVYDNSVVAVNGRSR
jgi:hypothetical protein